MRLGLTDDQVLFLDTVRKYLEQELPLTVVRALHDAGGAVDREEWRRRAELGWLSLLVPEEDGGGSVSGAGLLDAMLLAEETGRLVSPGPFVPGNIVAWALARSGSEEQRATVLLSLLSGETVATWAFAEPGGALDVTAVTLQASRKGEDWMLDGSKSFVQDVSSADLALVVARADEGVCQFLVPLHAPRLTIRQRESLDLVRQFGDIDLDGVRVPASALVGAAGGAGADVEEELRLAIVLHNAETVGAMNRVFDMTLEYSMDRVAFGRPIGSYQALKHRFADMKTWLEASNAIADASAWAVYAGTDDRDELVAAARSYIGDRSVALVQDCIQIHGGIGVTWDHDLHLYLRRVTQNGDLYGSPRFHRQRLAKMLAP